ncbi:sugar ABC transporter ATP-binding protein [Clostridium grantii]|uniref:Monosaccharide ABC transporter ATP-binding protein, CUT2 family n=1 Tax=Clostridium grantii DSM 8605 TaxID=1121316 RepID=A0A1M5V692_9CLOT|nr:sugar ABC transporter ATP-binding protein [Clostridium grantii]SHH70721.1 monosaccharide ABC transporter ATP-binding protein, CUT2 family [Clostridium grantii DSM 8605]
MQNSVVEPILSVKNLKKAFSGKTVVDGVSFDLYPGEIIALVGENGAGKSTLKNMLCGLLKPTEGQIFVDGAEIQHINGFEHGISAVHQELSLFQSLSVAANICITQLPGSAGNVDWKKAQRISKEQLDFLGTDIDPNTLVESLSVGKQQIVEIAKALLRSDRLLILDEPTTSLTAPEREKLFTIMRRLKEKGIAILFISHFMDEILSMSDKYIVLRDGKQVGHGNIEDVSRNALEEMMVGRTIGESQVDIGTPREEEAIRVEHLNSYDFHDVSFSVKKGEILGIAGLIGAGRTEVIESIFGVRKSEGNIYINNELVPNVTVAKMKERKVCFVTEDRKANGIFPNRSVRENISAASIIRFIERKVKRLGFKGETLETKKVVAEMNVSIPHIESKITSLSGGNQQKVIIGRWLSTTPEIIILDEPTKGVDIGAKFDIHNMIADFAKKGVAVIIVSSDLPELLTLSHRILVMRTGHIVGEVNKDEFDSVKIISMAASSAYKNAEERGIC